MTREGPRAPVAATPSRGPRLRPTPAVYAAHQQDYLEAALGVPLPLPERCKKKPPKGYTGRSGKQPTARRLGSWRTTRPAGNIALRLAPDVFGLDVDGYEPKTGRQTLEKALAAWGPLPATVRSSSRRDGVSGIYLYRVPVDLRWMSYLAHNLTTGPTGHIDVIHHCLRYAVAPPSRHPSGHVYRWLDEEGVLLDLPRLEDLPRLPERWIEALSRPDTRVVTAPVAERGARPPRPKPGIGEAPTTPPPSGGAQLGLDGEGLLARQAALVAAAGVGDRNRILYVAAMHCGGDPWQDQEACERTLVAAAQGLPARQAKATFNGGWDYGRGA